MAGLRILPYEPSYVHGLQHWFDQRSAVDTLLKLPLSPSTLYGPHHEPKSWVAINEHEDIVVVFTLASDNSGRGYLNFAVKPSERRRGIGEEALGLFLEIPDVKSIYKLEALAGPENIGGQKLLSQAGFIKMGYSQDGQLIFEKRFN